VGYFAFAIGILVAGLTAFYSWRVAFFTFNGHARWTPEDLEHHWHNRDHAHDGHDDHHDHDDHQHHHDHNLRAAYLHVIADAAVSVLAIIGLLAGRQLGRVWMDPAMGRVGPVRIARWSVGVAKVTGRGLPAPFP